MRNKTEFIEIGNQMDIFISLLEKKQIQIDIEIQKAEIRNSFQRKLYNLIILLFFLATLLSATFIYLKIVNLS
tara:strand:+ start:890 stop:1108 length:219 start_codon:yes stop_codon:yes gene_type:complete